MTTTFFPPSRRCGSERWPVHQIYQGNCGGPTVPDVLTWYGIQDGDGGEYKGSVDDKNWQTWHDAADHSHIGSEG